MNVPEKVIWQYWNDNNIPALQKKCIESVERYKGDYQVILLNDDMIKDYVDIDERIWYLYLNDEISIQLFSDFLRLYLLCKYGGIWIDATVYLTDYIPDEYLNKDLFFYQRDFNDSFELKLAFNLYDSGYFKYDNTFPKILSSFIVAKPDNHILKETLNRMVEYFNSNSESPSYYYLHMVLDEVIDNSYTCDVVSDVIPHMLIIKLTRPEFLPYVSVDDILKKCSIHKFSKRIKDDEFLSLIDNIEKGGQ